ncbi:polysaccharide biosynthesis/export family protein [Winogradskyella sp.]|nr:polysaccharide biosynthesis/export family protein [Winogradskyella sp.]
MKRKLFLYAALALIVASCATKKDVLYNQDQSTGNLLKEYQNLTLQKGDILDIKISALNPESVVVFQKTTGLQQNIQPEALKIQGYLVDAQGLIELPLIGNVNVLGLSSSAVEDLLETKLSTYVIDPVVTVRLVNYKITVLGEVARPGTFTFLEERMTLPMVLGTAGDLTINGDRRNVQVVRTQGDSLVGQQLDLTRGDLTNSPYYYMQQNDLIYVGPNTAKVKSSGLVGNVGTLTSVLSLILSLTLVLTR